MITESCVDYTILNYKLYILSFPPFPCCLEGKGHNTQHSFLEVNSYWGEDNIQHTTCIYMKL